MGKNHEKIYTKLESHRELIHVLETKNMDYNMQQVIDQTRSNKVAAEEHVQDMRKNKQTFNKEKKNNKQKKEEGKKEKLNSKNTDKI